MGWVDEVCCRGRCGRAEGPHPSLPWVTKEDVNKYRMGELKLALESLSILAHQLSYKIGHYENEDEDISLESLDLKESLKTMKKYIKKVESYLDKVFDKGGANLKKKPVVKSVKSGQPLPRTPSLPRTPC